MNIYPLKIIKEPLEIRDFSDVHASLLSLSSWVEDFLGNTNELLGREGPTCPYTRKSMKDDLLWFTVISEDYSIDKLFSHVQELKNWFIKRELKDEKFEEFRAVISVYTGLTDAALKIKSLQINSKSDFVKEGLMVGEFFPGCDTPGLWNTNFRPLDSPISMIAIRNMVQTDLAFLRDTEEYFKAWLSKFPIPNTKQKCIFEEAKIKFNICTTL